MALVSRLIPQETQEALYLGLLAAQEYLLSLGITGWQDAIVGRGFGDDDVTSAYLRAVSAGTLTVDVVGAQWWLRDGGMEQVAEMARRRERDALGRFRPTSVKMMLDGVAENHTAALLDPYYDGHGCQTENSGLDFIDPRELPRYVTALDKAGFQVHFHALGDRAVRNALDAIETARAANGDSGIRHHLAHLQVIHPDDIPRFAALGATANIQPLWATNEAQMTELTIPFLGERRAAWQYPFGELAASGAHLAGGSDWPVSSPNPLLGIHVAVNRSLPESAGNPLLPRQALTRQQALAAYTAGTALVNGVAGRAGSVKHGYQADFAVTDADLATVADAEICQVSVAQTWVRGQLAYQGNT
jgi:predicted amidohydrolase YtcJ